MLPRCVITSQGPIHLLLTEIELPKMSGEVVALAVRTRHPDVKVLLASGCLNFGENPDPKSAYLFKPFTPTTLVDKVREILAGW